MADNNSNADTPDSVPTGEGNTPHAKSSLIKDKQCQYCGQAFTSSSLGRHLDQFLSKKKPDGIHDVEEIKKTRASITRRQARISSARTEDDGDEDTSEHAQRKTGDYTPVTIPFVDKNVGRDLHMILNRANWHSTGVINEISGAEPPAQSRPVGSSHVSLKRPAMALDSPAKAEGSDSATIRALELALHEVLDNVQAAK